MDYGEFVDECKKAPLHSVWWHKKTGHIYRVTGHAMIESTWVPGVPIIISAATDTTEAVTQTWDVAYGEELAQEIEARVNGLFCNTYQICGLDAVDIGEVVVRKVIPPAAVAAEADALDAAQLAQQTEQALNLVEEIRAARREAEGEGYGNLFGFLPAGSDLSASDAAEFLRAAAAKTEADAQAYMQRQLAESIKSAMENGQPLPSLIISTGGNTPTPVFDPRATQ